MRKMLGLAVAAGLGISGLAVPAYAMPVGQNASVNTDSSLIKVRQGCGIGWHRDFYGACVPNNQPVYRYEPYPPPVYVAPQYPRVVEYPRVYNPYPPRYVVQQPPVIYYP